MARNVNARNVRVPGIRWTELVLNRGWFVKFASVLFAACDRRKVKSDAVIRGWRGIGGTRGRLLSVKGQDSRPRAFPLEARDSRVLRLIVSALFRHEIRVDRSRISKRNAAGDVRRADVHNTNLLIYKSTWAQEIRGESSCISSRDIFPSSSKISDEDPYGSHLRKRILRKQKRRLANIESRIFGKHRGRKDEIEGDNLQKRCSHVFSHKRTLGVVLQPLIDSI